MGLQTFGQRIQGLEERVRGGLGMGTSHWACELLTLWVWAQMEKNQAQSLDSSGLGRMMVLLRTDGRGTIR